MVEEDKFCHEVAEAMQSVLDGRDELNLESALADEVHSDPPPRKGPPAKWMGDPKDWVEPEPPTLAELAERGVFDPDDPHVGKEETDLTRELNARNWGVVCEQRQEINGGPLEVPIRIRSEDRQ